MVEVEGSHDSNSESNRPTTEVDSSANDPVVSLVDDFHNAVHTQQEIGCWKEGSERRIVECYHLQFSYRAC